VWHLRVDVHVLDHAGNLVDACGLASLAALMAFRRPDVTVGGGDDGQVCTRALPALPPGGWWLGHKGRTCLLEPPTVAPAVDKETLLADNAALLGRSAPLSAHAARLSRCTRQRFGSLCLSLSTTCRCPSRLRCSR
jgi:hypothetical protein